MVLSALDTSSILMAFHSIQFSVCSAVILVATFVPKGSFSINPKAIEGVRNEQEFEDDSSIDSGKGDVEGGRREKGERVDSP